MGIRMPLILLTVLEFPQAGRKVSSTISDGEGKQESRNPEPWIPFSS